MENVILFGTGGMGKSAYKKLSGDGFRIICFVDNDESKWGSKLFDIEIISPHSLTHFIINSFNSPNLVIAVTKGYEVFEQLSLMQISIPIYMFNWSSGFGPPILKMGVDFNSFNIEYFNNYYNWNNNPYSISYSEMDDISRFEFCLNILKKNDNLLVNICDIGCAAGQFANYLFDNGYKNYTGIDISEVAIQQCKTKYPEIAHKFLCTNVLVNPTILKGYDFYTCFEVLEHIIDDIKLLTSLPSGSKICFSVPNFLCEVHCRYFESLSDIIERYGQYIDILDYEKGKNQNWKNHNGNYALHHLIYAVVR